MTCAALIGCNQAPSKTGETPSQPNLSEQFFVIDKSVTWAAYQKGGAWQTLELNKTGDTVLSFAVERGAFTFVCDDSAKQNPAITTNTLYT